MFDQAMPTTQAGWLWLCFCSIGILAVLGLTMTLQLEGTVAEQGYGLESIQADVESINDHVEHIEAQVDRVDKNVVRICTSLEINCVD